MVEGFRTGKGREKGRMGTGEGDKGRGSGPYIGRGKREGRDRDERGRRGGGHSAINGLQTREGRDREGMGDEGAAEGCIAGQGTREREDGGRGMRGRAVACTSGRERERGETAKGAREGRRREGRGWHRAI